MSFPSARFGYFSYNQLEKKVQYERFLQVCDGTDDCPAAGDSSEIGEEEDGEGLMFQIFNKMH